eukprot:TRINITY_DN1361_c0_g1_i3.p1 TRINITY_DN1361_c0_g1~~TRINITY_DN1361_c0_g1_i3.p1  ORF type:complete len:377 (+),score=49.43 TRINITY_DN1361_c0_g1_i3:54-1184(+)
MLSAELFFLVIQLVSLTSGLATFDPVAQTAESDVLRPVPDRLSTIPPELVSTINDWHFAMMNDHHRNECFKEALREAIAQETSPVRVLDVGSGSGLLSLLAVQNGAAQVHAVEGNEALAEVSKKIITKNKMDDKIKVLTNMSVNVGLEDIGNKKADIMVSEVLGTLLLGESAIEYMADARDRLLKPGGHVIPSGAAQFVSVISSSKLRSVIKVDKWNGLDLSEFNSLQDTSSLVFSKQYGFRLLDVGPLEISPQLEIFSVDFRTAQPGEISPHPVIIKFKSLHTATVDAFIFHWTAWTDPLKVYNISTHWSATENNFQRDMAWGQAIQLVEEGDHDTPREFNVQKGEKLIVEVHNIESFTGIYAVLKRDSDSKMEN